MSNASQYFQNESLWEGTFGDKYIARNDDPFVERKPFWKKIVYDTGIRNVLEVGCNIGHNIVQIAEWLPKKSDAWGMDINEKAIHEVHVRHPGINAVIGSGFDLPFRDGQFDMAFTAGVLIHQLPDEAELMMQEIIRVSSKYVLAVEYGWEGFEEIPYGGPAGALWKGPYGEIYENKYGLRLVEKGFLDDEHGFDRCTYWLLSLN